MKLKIFSVCISFVLLFPTLVIGQLSLPSKAMGEPLIFNEKHEQDSWNWAEIVRQRNWGKLSQDNKWSVFVDRDGVLAYKQPSAGSSVEATLQFMDAYFVAKEENGFALLYEEKYKQTGLEISKHAKAIGWVSVDDLLLWKTCPRTVGQVYQKAVIVKDLDELQGGKDITNSSPYLLRSLNSKKSTGWVANDLEFFFVFKATPQGALLFEDSKLREVGEITKVKKGWIKRGMYTDWNERLCFEPNYGDDYEGKTAAIFKKQADARTFKQTGTFDQEDVFWYEKLSKKRWSSNMVRFPVLEMRDEFIARVGTIGSIGNGGPKEASKSRSALAEAKRQVDVRERKMDRVNVVFVMDGTSSMKNYYQPMAKAIQDAMNQNSMRGANMYFGAVVYRNYADGDRLTEMKQLTQDYQSIANWLVSRECKSIGESHYEAMYYGLDYAISNMNWSKDNCNFLILVGDAANDPNDKKGKTLNGVVSKLADYGVNFVAFQANHMNHAAYHEFPLQVQKIMINELSQLMGRQVKRNDFGLSNQMYQVKSKEYEWPIYSSAYRFAQIDKSENAVELERIVEDKIVDFKRQANDQLVFWRQEIEKWGNSDSTTGSPGPRINVEKVLRDMGLTQDQIQALKDGNAALKVKGYATRTADGENVFVPSVFMAKAELDDLISSLEKVCNNVSTDRRQSLQSALKTLALSYVGQGKDVNNMSVDEIMEAVSGLTAGTGKNVLAGVNLKDLTNPNKVSDSKINDFVDLVRSDVDLLKRKRNDKSCYFDSKNHKRYYYILLADMPLQDHDDN